MDLSHLNSYYIDTVIEYHLNEKKRRISDPVLVAYIAEKLKRNELEYDDID